MIKPSELVQQHVDQWRKNEHDFVTGGNNNPYAPNVVLALLAIRDALKELESMALEPSEVNAELTQLIDETICLLHAEQNIARGKLVKARHRAINLKIVNADLLAAFANTNMWGEGRLVIIECLNAELCGKLLGVLGPIQHKARVTE